MKLRRAYRLFFHPSEARNAFERIDANMTIALSNAVAAVVLLTVALLARVVSLWLQLRRSP